jgi:hypothetical protein
MPRDANVAAPIRAAAAAGRSSATNGVCGRGSRSRHEDRGFGGEVAAGPFTGASSRGDLSVPGPLSSC